MVFILLECPNQFPWLDSFFNLSSLIFFRCFSKSPRIINLPNKYSKLFFYALIAMKTNGNFSEFYLKTLYNMRERHTMKYFYTAKFKIIVWILSLNPFWLKKKKTCMWLDKRNFYTLRISRFFYFHLTVKSTVFQKHGTFC